MSARRAAGGRARAWRGRLGSVLALAGVLAALLAAGWVRATAPDAAADLRPRPDALEYEAAAASLAHGHGYWLDLVDGRRPPRYPIGFSLLLVPVLWIAGDEPGTGVLAVQGAALAGIALTALLAARAGGPASAVAAAWLLAASPLHASWSRAVMADVPASTLVAALALAGLVVLERARGPRAWLALGVAVGLACAVRPIVAAVVPPLAVLGVVRWGRTALAGPLALAAGVAVGAMPWLVEAAWRWGRPLGDGYAYWVPHEPFFAARYVLGPPKGGGTTANLVVYAAALAGRGRLYPWPVALLAAAGAVLAAWRRGIAGRLAAVAAGTTAAVLAVQLPFFWQWDRFLLPVVPLVVAVAALPVGRAAPLAVRVVAAGLVVAAVVLVRRAPEGFAPPDRPSGEVARLRAVAAHVEADAALLAPTAPLLAARVLRPGTDRVLVPLGFDEHGFAIAWFGLRPLAPATDAARWLRPAIAAPRDVAAGVATVEALVAEGRPVYLLRIAGHDAAQVLRALEPRLVERFRFEPVPGVPGLLRLAPRSQPSANAP